MRGWISANDQPVYFFGYDRRLIEETGLFYDGNQPIIMTGIIEDTSGHLWFSSSHGIWFLDSETSKVRQFTETDGLQSHSFKIGSHHMGASGKLFLCGHNGFNYFDPEFNNSMPDVALIDLLQMNNVLNTGDEGFS